MLPRKRKKRGRERDRTTYNLTFSSRGSKQHVDEIGKVNQDDIVLLFKLKLLQGQKRKDVD